MNQVAGKNRVCTSMFQDRDLLGRKVIIFEKKIEKETF